MSRVLIVASWYPSDRDPVGGIFVEDQARALAAVHDVVVIAPDMRRLVDARRGGLPAGLVTERRNGLLVLRPGVIAVATWRQAGWSYSRAVERAYARLARTWGPPELIHAHVVFPGGWSAARLSRKLGVPWVLTEHSGPFSARLTTSWLRRTALETLRSASSRIAVSPALRREMQSFLDIDVDVVGNVCDTNYFRPPDEPAGGPARRFLALGILTAVKGVDVLLDAGRLLVDRGWRDWELVVGGDGPARPELEAQARRLGLGSRCRFVGALSREEVRRWMQWSDAFVLPSRHESFGMVVVEALACDRPVVATRSGGPEHILTDEVGALVQPGDAAGLADALTRVLDGRLRPPRGVARRRAVERFGPDAFLRAIEPIYARAMRS
jgi:glycosyltransferase involved in cell wall biosynthesis